MKQKHSYGEAIRLGFEYLLDNYPDVFIIGQGLWSPWYVGNSMTNLDKNYGTERIIDTPVSESAVTGAAVGASIVGMRPIVVHPRMDFMLYAMDSIVNQAAKWSQMFGGQSNAPVTIRGIINRGGEQGAQHSQALHTWFAHIPGLRVVMPSTVKDARDLLISSVLSNDPVVFIDDRWLYDQEEELEIVEELDLNEQKPEIQQIGTDITIVSLGFASKLARDSIEDLLSEGISAELIDVRILNPLEINVIVDSVKKTKNLLVIDPATKFCGYAAEIITGIMEVIEPNEIQSKPVRISLPDAPAPCSSTLEKDYYFNKSDIIEQVKLMLQKKI